MFRSPRRPGSRDFVTPTGRADHGGPGCSCGGLRVLPEHLLLLALVCSQLLLASLVLHTRYTPPPPETEAEVAAKLAATKEQSASLQRIAAQLTRVVEVQKRQGDTLAAVLGNKGSSAEALAALAARVDRQYAMLEQIETLLDNVDFEQHQCRTRCEDLLTSVVSTAARVDSRRAKLCYWGDENAVLDEVEPFPRFRVRWNDSAENQTAGGGNADAAEGGDDAQEGAEENKRSSRVLVISAIFDTGASRPYLQFFLRTAATSGVDYLLFGDPPMQFDLPSNVKHVHITWDELVNRIEAMVFGGRPLTEMRKASVYKVIDVKPLYGLLFQRFLKGYDFWAYGDSDMLIGNLTRFINDSVLDNFDVISGAEPDSDHQKTWGPLTLMRNTPLVNELFRQTPGLYHVFNTQFAHFFDEWGGDELEWYNASMSARVNEMIDAGKLRWHGGFPHGWDGACRRRRYEASCSECHFLNIPGLGSKLWWNRTFVRKGVWPRGEARVIEVMLCHFQFGKDRANELLSKMGVVEGVMLRRATDFYQSYGNGFYTKPKRMKTAAMLPAAALPAAARKPPKAK